MQPTVRYSTPFVYFIIDKVTLVFQFHPKSSLVQNFQISVSFCGTERQTAPHEGTALRHLVFELSQFKFSLREPEAAATVH